MKKIAMLMAVLLVIGTAPAWALVATLDHAIEHVSESDMRPVADTGRVLDLSNRGIDTVYNAVTGPMAPVLDPVRRVRDESVGAAKKVINTTWDVVTFRHFRERE